MISKLAVFLIVSMIFPFILPPGKKGAYILVGFGMFFDSLVIAMKKIIFDAGQADGSPPSPWYPFNFYMLLYGSLLVFFGGIKLWKVIKEERRSTNSGRREPPLENRTNPIILAAVVVLLTSGAWLFVKRDTPMDLDSFSQHNLAPKTFDFVKFTPATNADGKENIFEYKKDSDDVESDIATYESLLRGNGLHCVTPTKTLGWHFLKMNLTTGCRCEAMQISRWLDDKNGLIYEIYYEIYAECAPTGNCALIKNWGKLLDLTVRVRRNPGSA